MKNLALCSTLICTLALAACSDDDGGNLDDGETSGVGGHISSSAGGASVSTGDIINSPGGPTSTGAGGGASFASAVGGFFGSPGAGGALASSGAGGTSSSAVGGQDSTDVEEEEESSMGGAAPVEVIASNPFVVVDHDPLSTFAADVDTASYDLYRSYVDRGELPPNEGVRLEEFVNYFDYDYPAPSFDSEHPFTIHLESSPNLVSRTSQILRVGIQGAELQPEDKKPTNLVFLVDVSGSMQAEMSTVQSALRQTLSLLDGSDTLAIVTYASSPGTLLSATEATETETILAAINGLSAGGSTNGSGGIDAAYAEAESAFIEGGINHVLICTDGDFNVGASSDDALEQLIIDKRETGITLTALGFGTQGVNDAMMERVSNAGNGIYAFIGNEAEAEKYVSERMFGSLVHIAKDMKLQVEFNPAHVYAYRLLGYENRAIADVDFRNDVVDAGEIGAGHRVTALYELILTEDDLSDEANAPALDDGEAFAGTAEVAADDFVLVKVRYKEPGATAEDPATEVSASLSPEAVAEGFEGSGSDLQWAVAVASFAEILKGSSYADRDSLSAIRLVLADQSELDADRAEFLRLFDLAVELLD